MHNLFWPNDAIWHCKTQWTLVQVLPCHCLMEMDSCVLRRWVENYLEKFLLQIVIISTHQKYIYTSLILWYEPEDRPLVGIRHWGLHLWHQDPAPDASNKFPSETHPTQAFLYKISKNKVCPFQVHIQAKGSAVQTVQTSTFPGHWALISHISI